MELNFPPKSDYNKNEIVITAIERKALLEGFAKASEHHLKELKRVRKPSLDVQQIIDKLETDLQEIRKEYATYESE